MFDFGPCIIFVIMSGAHSLCWFLDLVLTVSKNLRAELLRKLDVDVICAEVDGISQEQNSHL